jgi:hypothetical protein
MPHKKEVRPVCAKHTDPEEDMLLEGEVSACEVCSGFLGSSSFLLCDSCGLRLAVCVFCRRPCVMTKNPSNIPEGANRI